ncbi:hypothetical protein [Streptomyces sp. NBC_01235]|uniref:hypothetical protein n=1 Tax=Streptomyces sp. NBC_01235 TaxID=2903788 RepID=UPI002E15B280|nr:hypothetical protein OG289_24090 [Streptomyces sp. NBC_01235]
MRERIAGFRESLLRAFVRALLPARHRHRHRAVQPEPAGQELPTAPVEAPPRRVPHLLSLERLQELYELERRREEEASA